MAEFPTPCPGTYGAGPLLVERPVVKPWSFGLFSAATLIDETDTHARNGIVYKSPACTADVAEWVDDCTNPPTKVPTAKTDEVAIVRGCPIHLYAYLDCRPGSSLDSMTAEATDIFNLGEQRAFEAAFWNKVLALPTATVLNASSNTADAMTVTGGIAALESAIAACYGGRATIHADRGIASFMQRDRLLGGCGGCEAPLSTALDTTLAFYGGSPNSSPLGVAAPTGYAWLYATSTPIIRRFPVEILPTDARYRLGWGANAVTNEPITLAERTYVPSVECCVKAVLVCLTC